jgi:hypothetical protein
MLSILAGPAAGSCETSVGASELQPIPPLGVARGERIEGKMKDPAMRGACRHRLVFTRCKSGVKTRCKSGAMRGEAATQYRSSAGWYSDWPGSRQAYSPNIADSEEIHPFLNSWYSHWPGLLFLSAAASSALQLARPLSTPSLLAEYQTRNIRSSVPLRFCFR